MRMTSCCLLSVLLTALLLASSTSGEPSPDEGIYRAYTCPLGKAGPLTPSEDASGYEWASYLLWWMNNDLSVAVDKVGQVEQWGDLEQHSTWTGKDYAAEYVRRVVDGKHELIDRLQVPYTAEEVSDDATLDGVPLKGMIELLKQIDATLESAGFIFVTDMQGQTVLSPESTLNETPQVNLDATIREVAAALASAKQAKEVLEDLILHNWSPEETPPAEGSAP